jgi:hypothetical protein
MSSCACTQQHPFHAPPQVSSTSCAADALGIKLEILKRQYVATLQHKCTVRERERERVSESESERESERERVCVCVRERESVCVRESE